MNFPENAISVLVVAYSLSSLIRLYFYLPQIRSVLRSSDAAAINVPTWVVWSCHNLLSALYGWYVTHDMQFALFFLASAGCTTLIASVAARKQLSIPKNITGA
jgi:uncharacterized protein with PQ loop repeat